MDWELSRNIVSTIQNVLASFAIIVGGLWAYYRFVRFRTLKPRLEFSFDLKPINYSQDITVAIVAVKASNKGNTRVDLRKNGKDRCFLQYGLLSPIDSPSALIAIDKTSEELENSHYVFTSHKWIEPGETIDDVKVLNVPSKNDVVIQLELIVYGEQKWSTSAAFPLTGFSSFTSEDEQDEYEEAETLIKVIKTALTEVNESILKSHLSEESKHRLTKLVDNAKSTLSIDTALRIISPSLTLEEEKRDLTSLESINDKPEKTLEAALRIISDDSLRSTLKKKKKGLTSLESINDELEKTLEAALESISAIFEGN